MKHGIKCMKEMDETTHFFYIWMRVLTISMIRWQNQMLNFLSFLLNWSNMRVHDQIKWSWGNDANEISLKHMSVIINDGMYADENRHDWMKWLYECNIIWVWQNWGMTLIIIDAVELPTFWSCFFAIFSRFYCLYYFNCCGFSNHLLLGFSLKCRLFYFQPHGPKFEQACSTRSLLSSEPDHLSCPLMVSYSPINPWVGCNLIK